MNKKPEDCQLLMNSAPWGQQFLCQQDMELSHNSTG